MRIHSMQGRAARITLALGIAFGLLGTAVWVTPQLSRTGHDLAANAANAGSPPANNAGSPAAAQAASPNASAPVYVNMGDSYSAGEGSFAYVQGTNTSTDMCHRSTQSYSGQYVASSIRFHSVTNVACAGAVIADLTSAPGASNQMQIPTQGEPAQISALNSSTRLVTLTIGANDLNLVGLLTNCYSKLSTAGIDSCFTSTINNNLFSQITNLEPTLEEAYKSIKSAAPNATLAVLTYPQIFPATYTTALSRCGNPRGVTPPVITSQNQLTGIRQVVDKLDKVIVQAAHAQGATVIDEESAFAGHEVCTQNSWVNPIVLNGMTPADESFHPTTAGYAKMAADLKAYFDAIAG